MTNKNTNVKISLNKSTRPKDFSELAHWYPWKLPNAVKPTKPMLGPNRKQRRTINK